VSRELGAVAMAEQRKLRLGGARGMGERAREQEERPSGAHGCAQGRLGERAAEGRGELG
jgi:hypothetical protein